MSDVFQPEQVVGGRYRVVRKLGGGGMADVYLCEDLTLGRHRRHQGPARALPQRPHVRRALPARGQGRGGPRTSRTWSSIYDWGEVDGTYYIAMEYVEGETLKDLIRRRGRLSGNESVAVTLQLARRGRLRPPQRHRPPRHQAAEHHDRPRRDRQGHGLRHRARRRLRDDGGRLDPRHRPVPGARAGEGLSGRRALRPVLGRRRASTRCSPAPCRSRATAP